MKQKFYYRWWFIALCCISGFFLPVGVILWILKTRSLQKELEKIITPQEIIDKAKEESQSIIDKAKKESQSIIDVAKVNASKLVEQAENQAEQAEIKANATIANAERRLANLTSASQAIKNTIEGYGDEYLIPASSVLDGLAEHFGFSDASKQFKDAKTQAKLMIKQGAAASCDYVEENRRKTACAFIVDAFNGKVDSIISKVKSGENYGKCKQSVLDAYSLVNFQGATFRNTRITEEFLKNRLEELKWAVVLLELKKKEQEEQREIKERIREEAKIAAEIEKAEKEARKEEARIKEAEAKLSQALLTATAEQRTKFESELNELRAKLKIAEEKFSRARSMAELTKSGHVYVISNIGSFGQHVFKIGMTRRLEPAERIKELGNASVPFPFDIHAMIYSKDAPSLENQLHEIFNENRVNKVNLRKEFFNVPIEKIKEALAKLEVPNVRFTLFAQAEEYRETLNIEKQKK